MSKVNDVINKFYESVGRTSTYETYRTLTGTNYNALASNIDKTKMSNLGTPVLDYVELILSKDEWKKNKVNAREYAYSSNTGKFKNTIANVKNQIQDNSINTKAVHLNNVEVSTNQTSNIVRTQINGLNGTFKEIYSNGDILISLTGQLTGYTSLQDDVRNVSNIKRIFENVNNDTINIHSRFINSLGVTTVVIADYSLTLNKEFSNVIDFTISLEQDEDLTIINEIE